MKTGLPNRQEPFLKRNCPGSITGIQKNNFLWTGKRVFPAVSDKGGGAALSRMVMELQKIPSESLYMPIHLIWIHERIAQWR